jgi:hypothetical protein
MASLTIRDIPNDLLTRMRALAARERRSLNRQVIVLLESSLPADVEAEEQRLRAESAAQVHAWQRLAEQFGADVDIAADDLLSARTAGRPVEL